MTLSGAGRGADAPLLRIFLGGLEGFGDGLDWTRVNPHQLVLACIRLRARLALPVASVMLMSDSMWASWVSRVEALLCLSWTEAQFSQAALFSNALEERTAVLRSLSKTDLTPERPPRPPESLGSQGEPRGEHGAHDAARRLGDGFPPPRDSDYRRAGSKRPRANASAGSASPSLDRDGLPGRFAYAAGGGLDPHMRQPPGGGRDSSDDEDEDDETGFDRHDTSAGRFRRDKRPRAGSNVENGSFPTENDESMTYSNYPSLCAVTPHGWGLAQAASLLCEGIIQGLGATDKLAQALATAKVPTRQVWGTDTRDVAEAVLAVAIAAVRSQEEFEIARPSNGEQGLRSIITRLLDGLQRVAAGRAEGEPGLGSGSAGSRGRADYGQLAKPQDDFERSIAGKAPVGPAVSGALAGKASSGARREWAARVSAAGDGIAANPPADCLRAAMADKFARRHLTSALEPELATALTCDADARERAARTAIERLLHASLPPKLDKHLMATLLSFQFGEMPKLSEVAAELSVKTVLGDAQHMKAATPAQAAAAIRAGLMAAYPELDLSAFLALEDDFRGLLEGHGQPGAGQVATRLRAAQLWTDTTAHFEKCVQDFRMGLKGDKGVRDIFDTPTVITKLTTQHAANMAAAAMTTAIAQDHHLTGDTREPKPKGAGGKQRLAALVSPWKQEFGEACIFFHAKGSCSHGAACTRLHAPPLDQAKVLAWVQANNADISA